MLLEVICTLKILGEVVNNAVINNVKDVESPSKTCSDTVAQFKIVNKN
jgi:hypothetical protein